MKMHKLRESSTDEGLKPPLPRRRRDRIFHHQSLVVHPIARHPIFRSATGPRPGVAHHG